MERMQIYLTEEQKETLQKLSEEQGTSVAELIRDAIDRQLQTTDLSAVHESLRESFGVWKDRTESTDRTSRVLRNEWPERIEDSTSNS